MNTQQKSRTFIEQYKTPLILGSVAVAVAVIVLLVVLATRKTPKYTPLQAQEQLQQDQQNHTIRAMSMQPQEKRKVQAQAQPIEIQEMQYQGPSDESSVSPIDQPIPTTQKIYDLEKSLVESEVPMRGPNIYTATRAERFDDTRHHLQSSGDSNAYLMALRQTGKSNLAETALDLKNNAEKLWSLSRQKAAEQATSKKTSTLLLESLPGGDWGSIEDGSGPSAYETNQQMIGEIFTSGTAKEKQTGPVMEGSDQHMLDIVQGKQAAIVFFYRDKCSFCEKVYPSFVEAATAYHKYHENDTEPTIKWLHVHASKAPNWVQALGVKGVPAIFLYKATESRPAAIPLEYSRQLFPQEKQQEYRTAKSFIEFVELM